MCGIAGYSLSDSSRLDRTFVAQALLAGIAERGADAVGYAWRSGSPEVEVRKQRSGASALLEDLSLPQQATQALIHVRDYTKGHPSIEANNHPVRHGSVVGIHNGIIANDDELFAAEGIERHHAEMSVDSEVIFALAEREHGSPHVFERFVGSMAAAWMDETRPGVLFLVRGVGRPLWTGHTRHETFFASTRHALEVVEDTLRMTLTKREVDEGTLLALAAGRTAWSERFSPDRSYVEEPLPAVRSAEEGRSCLARLAAIASTAY
jgi:glucosamine 6-phosphate synthetase-like amidotransferase/phosphosugar isomerase protein